MISVICSQKLSKPTKAQEAQKAVSMSPGRTSSLRDSCLLPAGRQCGRAQMTCSLFSHGGDTVYADTRLESTVHFLSAKSYLGLTNPERESLISWIKTLRLGPSHCTG